MNHSNEYFYFIFSSYNEYKIVFLKNQRAEHLRMKIAMEEILKNELQERFEEAGFKEDDETEAEIPAGVREEQTKSLTSVKIQINFYLF